MATIPQIIDITDWAYAGAPADSRPDMHDSRLDPAVSFLGYRLGGARAVFTTAAFGNIGDHVGDNPGAVAARRARLAAYLGQQEADETPDDGARITWLRQVHSHICYAPPADQASSGTDRPVPTADALVLGRPPAGQGALAGAIMTADCVPLLYASADGAWIGAAHAGRVGILDNVIGESLRVLYSRAGTHSDIAALIGPHICPACYEISPSMAQEIAHDAPELISHTAWQTPSFDLTGAAARQLAAHGVTSIGLLAVCTAVDPTLFSYRRALGQGALPTGRQASVVVVEKSTQ